MFAVCPSGFYGMQCLEPCDCDSACDPIDGHCICAPGQMGVSCDQGKLSLTTLLFTSNIFC